RMTSFYQWILLYHVGPDLTFSARRLHRIVSPRDRFWADPVMLRRDGRHFVFVEEYMYQSQKGHIAVLEIDDTGRHTPPRKVLERPYHLSYPFVFEWQGKTYMVPESFQNRSIELYECLTFPDRWELRMNLMEGISAADPTLLFHDGRWWMFATVQEYEGASH